MSSLLDLPNFLAVLGLILAVSFYVRSIRQPLLLYKAANVTIIGEETLPFPENLEVSYNGRPVDSLKKSWIIFWNAGNKEIRSPEVAPTKPITVRCVDGKILDAQIIKATTPANRATLGGGEAETLFGLEFDYFNPKDGVSIQILHSGRHSRIEMSGDLIGGPPIRAFPVNHAIGVNKASVSPALTQESTVVSYLLVLVCFGIAGLITSLAFNLIPDSVFRESFKWLESVGVPKVIDVVMFGIGLALAALFCAAAIWGIWFNARWRHPKTLSITPS